MGKNEPEAKQWFAIRVTYSREMALKEYLDRCRMESFIPMSYKEVIKGERKVRKLVPVIHNLVFVRSTREKLDEMKRDISLKSPYAISWIGKLAGLWLFPTGRCTAL